MNNPSVGVVYYGAGNVFSTLRGLRKAGFEPRLVETPEDLARCGRLVLPGVGAFGLGMANLRAAGLDLAVRDHVAAGRPLLGICLGAQLLMEWSDEFGRNDGLGLIQGGVAPIERVGDLRVPHVGWAALIPGPGGWENGPLDQVRPGVDHLYFVHSFVCRPDRDDDVLARFDYGPHRMTAAVRRDNVVGVQFHPELSSRAGLRILRRFAAL